MRHLKKCIVLRYIRGGVLPTQRLTAADYQALAEFRYQIRTFLHFSDQAAHRAGLEPSQHQVLLAVKGHPGEPTVGDLAERLHLRHHSVVGLLDRLAVRDLVRRSRGNGDRRQVRVRLTRKGDAILRRLSLEHRVELESGGDALLDALRVIVGRPRTHSTRQES